MIDLEKNRRQVVRVEAKKFQGKDILDVRVFYRDGAGDLRPTTNGVAVRLDQAEDLANAILGEAARETSRV